MWTRSRRPVAEEPSASRDAAGVREARVVHIEDERDPRLEAALSLIRSSFSHDERQPTRELRMEVEEKRLGLLTSYDFHLLAAVAGDRVLGVASGVYLAGVNTGFVGYLTTRTEAQGAGLGTRLRGALVDALRANAREHGYAELDGVVGEIEAESPWLRRMVEQKAAVPFDIPYLQPRLSADRQPVHLVLYRQPVGGRNGPLPPDDVKKLIHALYRRAYRVRYPLRLPGFRKMLSALERANPRE